MKGNVVVVVDPAIAAVGDGNLSNAVDVAVADVDDDDDGGNVFRKDKAT